LVPTISKGENTDGDCRKVGGGFIVLHQDSRRDTFCPLVGIFVPYLSPPWSIARHAMIISSILTSRPHKEIAAAAGFRTGKTDVHRTKNAASRAWVI
jgi:hypothetical protein